MNRGHCRIESASAMHAILQVAQDQLLRTAKPLTDNYLRAKSVGLVLKPAFTGR